MVTASTLSEFKTAPESLPTKYPRQSLPIQLKLPWDCGTEFKEIRFLDVWKALWFSWKAFVSWKTLLKLSWVMTENRLDPSLFTPPPDQCPGKVSSKFGLHLWFFLQEEMYIHSSSGDSLRDQTLGEGVRRWQRDSLQMT